MTTVAVLLAGLAAWGWLRPTPQVHATRSFIDLGDVSLAPWDEILVSPDGSRFVVTGTVDGQRSLYWRDAAEENFQVVPGTENVGDGAAFSPDGDWIVYATRSPNALFKVSLSGGAPTTVVPSGDVDPRLPHWGDDGMIVFTGPYGLFLVPDTGGEPEPLLGPNPNFRNPSLLPGGRSVIGARLGGGIVLLDLETDSVRELIPGGIDPQYVETGHILYADASGGLWAVPFDAGRGEVLGGAVPILDGLSVLGPNARFSVSRNGTLVYGAGAVGPAPGGFGTEMRLLVVYLDGREEVLVLPPRIINEVNWSPDGRSVVYSAVMEGDSDPDIYTYDVRLATTPRQLTFEGQNRFPVFSPDSTRIAFASLRDGTDAFDLFVKRLEDDEPATSVITLPIHQIPTQWPSDGLIVFEESPSFDAAADLWMLDLTDPENPVAVEYLSSEANLRDIMVSPDGTLAAYTSDETGTNEVYIRSFPEPGERTPVSQGGGEFPFWSPGGDIVYYWMLAGDISNISGDAFVAARIQRNPTPVVLSRDSLFTGNYYRPASDLHPEGDRLVVAQTVAAATNLEGGASDPERFLVVVNWFEELRQRMGN